MMSWVSHRPAATVICAVLLSVAACDGESRAPGPNAIRPSPSPPREHGTGCPNGSTAADNRGSLRRGRLAGDVDGDGSTDQISLAVDADARPGCRAFVVVQTAEARLIAPIGERHLEIDLGFPVLDSLVGVDHRVGGEIVVRIAAGASTEFAGLFTVVDDALERVRLNGPHGNLFPSGGSVGHLEASNCGPDGAVVISIATARGRRYVLERRFHFFEETSLVEEESLAERRRISPDALASFPEFGAPPFSLCRPLP
jgi:hypothetical protein